jgi:meso-butanediol dehydrogenase / (S,S)-butanediol dehydrogenase / diacetyl reductase
MNGGSVINVSSGVTVQPASPGRGIYAATKAAVNLISRTAAVEWGPDGIRVNTILPFARTESTRRLLDEEPEYAAKVIKAVPLGRVGDPESDVGRVVVFLASDEARYVTGTIIPVDGGLAFVR